MRVEALLVMMGEVDVGGIMVKDCWAVEVSSGRGTVSLSDPELGTVLLRSLEPVVFSTGSTGETPVDVVVWCCFATTEA